MGCGGTKQVVEPVQEQAEEEEAMPEPIFMEEEVKHEPEPVFEAPVVKAEAVEIFGPETDMERKYWDVLKNYPDYKFEKRAGEGSYGEVLQLRHRSNNERISIYA